MIGAASGRLLIPTIVLPFAVDVTIGGSLSLAVSPPTMLIAFARYSQHRSFELLRRNKSSSLRWPLGPSPAPSSAGLLLGVTDTAMLIPA